MYTGLEYPAKMEEKLSQHDIASYTAKRHQLVCWQASISVSWAIGGVCKALAGVFWHYSWQCHAVKAFLPFLQGIPAWYTELHMAYLRWLVGKTQVFISPSHDHLLSK